MIVMPACYSDGLYGVYKGMHDLVDMGYIKALPKMVAAEVFGSMEETLRQGAEFPVSVPAGPSVSFSIAGSVCTYQGLEAVRKSNGFARSSSDAETMDMQLLLAKTEGIYAEASSVTALVAAAKLAKEGNIGEDERVVAILTSTGLKDPAETKKHLPSVPTIQPNVAELRKALKDAYGVTV